MVHLYNNRTVTDRLLVGIYHLGFANSHGAKLYSKYLKLYL